MGNHYVPKFYLKGFTHPDKTNVVTRYQKGTEEVLQTSLNNVAQETGFYSDDTEAFLSDSIEDPANAVIERIRAREPIDQTGKSTLADYMIVMLKRVPKGRERVAAYFEEFKPIYKQALLAEIDSLEREHPDKAAILHARRDEVERIFSQNRIKPETIWEINMPATNSPLMQNAIPLMKWQFLVTQPPDYFLTS